MVTITEADVIGKHFLFLFTAGLIQNLWSVLEYWISRNTRVSIRISYKTHQGKLIEVTYDKLSQKKEEEILTQNPPELSTPTRITIL